MDSSEGTPAVADLDAIPVETTAPVVDNSFDLDFSDNNNDEDGDEIPDFF